MYNTATQRRPIAETIVPSLDIYTAVHDNTVDRNKLCSALSNIKICRTVANLEPADLTINIKDVTDKDERLRAKESIARLLMDPTDDHQPRRVNVIGEDSGHLFLMFAVLVMIAEVMNRPVFICIYDEKDQSIPNFYRTYFIRYLLLNTPNVSVSIILDYIRSIKRVLFVA